MCIHNKLNSQIHYAISTKGKLNMWYDTTQVIKLFEILYLFMSFWIFEKNFKNPSDKNHF